MSKKRVVEAGVQNMSTNVVELKRSSLVPGDWITMEYGFSDKLFYVHNVYATHVSICNTSWCVSDSDYYSFSTLTERGFVYIGRTKPKWYWRFLPWRDLVCPYYSLRNFYA